MADETICVSDSTLASSMAAKDEASLRLFLQQFGGRLKAYLRKYFPGLQECDREEAFNTVVLKVWKAADRYDSTKGSLGAWCIKIAQKTALDILRRESKYHIGSLLSDPSFESNSDSVEDRTCVDGPEERVDIVLLRQGIEQLPELQKAIIKADLENGGCADAQILSRKFNTTANSIYVSRTKARKKLATLLVQVRGVVRGGPHEPQ